MVPTMSFESKTFRPKLLNEFLVYRCNTKRAENIHVAYDSFMYLYVFAQYFFSLSVSYV